MSPRPTAILRSAPAAASRAVRGSRRAIVPLVCLRILPPNAPCPGLYGAFKLNWFDEDPVCATGGAASVFRIIDINSPVGGACGYAGEGEHFPWQTARAGAAPPVPLVLSGRDQASPTPFDDIRTRSEALDVVSIQCDYGNCVVVDAANPGRRVSAGAVNTAPHTSPDLFP